MTSDRPITGEAIPIPRVQRAGQPSGRLKRIRGMAWLLDRSIPIGRWRIGLDPILGLIPGAGDWIGALLSLYILYEGGRLGIKSPVLARMGGNILLEAIIGIVPFLGDIFDFAWKANTRNVALIEQHYRPGLAPRSMQGIWLTFALVVVVVLAALVGLTVLMFKAINSILS